MVVLAVFARPAVDPNTTLRQGCVEGEGVLTSRVGVLTEGEGVLTEGEGVLTEGEGVLSGGVGVLTEGVGVLTVCPQVGSRHGSNATWGRRFDHVVV